MEPTDEDRAYLRERAAAGDKTAAYALQHGPVSEAEGTAYALELIDAIATGNTRPNDKGQRRAAYQAMGAIVAVLTIAESQGSPASMLRFLRLAVHARKSRQ